MKPTLPILSLLLVGLLTLNQSQGATVVQASISPTGEVSVTSASGSGASFTPSGSEESVSVAEGQSFSSETGTVAATDPSNSFGGGGDPVDARSAEGAAIAASSSQPNAGTPGDMATAAGGEGDLGATETAAGGGGGADTQSPLAPTAVPQGAVTQGSLAPVTSSPNPGLTTPI